MTDDVCLIPHSGSRVETGIIVFGNDWPGIFLQGDSAFGHAINLKGICEKMKGLPEFSAIEVMQIIELYNLLRSADVKKEKTLPEISP